MAQISGAVNLTGMIAPTDSLDVYPTHSSVYGLGGYREVADQAARDAIPLQRRTHGMMVFQQNDGKIYQLGSGLTNNDWSEFVLTTTTDDLVEGSTNLIIRIHVLVIIWWRIIMFNCQIFHQI